MKIAVLSGKGGTGKTTLSVNLFSNIKNATMIDADVEEPNGHIFLDYKLIDQTSVNKTYPKVDYDKCTLCGACGEICQFNSIIPTKKTVLVMADLCHDCGGCKLVCESNAITYIPKEIGTIKHGKVGTREFYYGDLNVGEISGVKVIEKLKAISEDKEILIIDSPPGTSCSTVSSVEDVDYAIIVSEPTPFGVSDMKMVVEMLEEMKIKFGVVVNKAGLGNDEIYTYLKEKHIELLEDIKFDRDFAAHYAKGKIISEHSSYYKEKIDNIIRKVLGDSYVN